jgi:RNA polymerase subunit RPABC4/transcription elongation factor Spt4
MMWSGSTIVGEDLVVKPSNWIHDENEVTHRSGEFVLGVNDKILLLPREKLKIAFNADISVPNQYLIIREGIVAITNLRLVFIGKAMGTYDAGTVEKNTFFQISSRIISSAELRRIPKRCRVSLVDESFLVPIRNQSLIEKYIDIKPEKPNKVDVEEIVTQLMALVRGSQDSNKSDWIINIPFPESPSSREDEVSGKTEASESICSSCGRTMREEWEACPYCCVELAPQVCPSCGKQLERDWKMCPFCKTMLKQEKVTVAPTCKQCGKPVKENWKKCPYCASQLGS